MIKEGAALDRHASAVSPGMYGVHGLAFVAPHRGMNPALPRCSLLIPSCLTSALLVLIFLWAGCSITTKAPPTHRPVRATSSADPAAEIQSRLLQDARVSLEQGRHETARLLLQRLVTVYPKSPLLPEARWSLARSYEQTSELEEALTQYRRLIQAAPGGSLGLQARKRIAELERTLRIVPSESDEHVAILIPTALIHPQQTLDPWVRRLAEAGVTTLVVEAGTTQTLERPQGLGGPSQPQGGRQAGVYFQTSWAPMLRDVAGQLIPVAHRHGLRVYSAVALWRMNWLEPHLGWTEQTYDRTKQQLVASEKLDLLHPAFQEYLVGLLADLVAGGIDGVFFLADVPRDTASGQGFSPYGLKAFERDFGVRLDPETLTTSASLMAPAGSRRDSAPEFWRWAGWRARETLKVMDRLRHALRKQSPGLQFALEVHPEAVTDPVGALVRLNEDFLEAKRLRFDAYVVSGSLLVGSGEKERMNRVVERAVELIGDAGRIWATVPLPGKDIALELAALRPVGSRASFGNGAGVFYRPTMNRPSGAVP